MKKCSKCALLKPLSDYHGDASKPDGRYSSCRDCERLVAAARRAARSREQILADQQRGRRWRENNPERARRNVRNSTLLKKYGISVEEYDKIHAEQGGKCSICGSTDPRGTKANIWLHVDHDHVTGAVRGLLCRPCNNALGAFSDSVPILERAIAYLEGSN